MEVEGFLSWLANERRVSTSTHRQALAALLLHMGLEPKLAELFLGLSYFPLYLIVRRAWMTARYKLLANDLDAFIEAPDIKA